MSAQDKVDQMARAGYWLGGNQPLTCDCTYVGHDELGEIHNKFCPKYKAEWVRRAAHEREQRGYVAVADKTGR